MKKPYDNLIKKLLTLPPAELSTTNLQYIIECIYHCQLQGIPWQRQLINEVLGDDWLTLCDKVWQDYCEQAKGYLYLAVDPSHPEFYKLGKAKSIAEREKSLFTAGMLVPLVIVAEWEVCNRHKLETLVRHEVAKHAKKHKEFFVGSYAELHPLIEQYIQHYTTLLS